MPRESERTPSGSGSGGHGGQVQLWEGSPGRPGPPLTPPTSVQGLLYAASHPGVVQVPVANCSLYQSCGDCVLARDPYCAWSGSRCMHVSRYQPEAASR